MNLDPPTAAVWALIAICFILVGAILTTGIVSVEQRAVVLAGIFSVLAAIAWRRRRSGDGS